jgi:hypothetical protein
MTNFNNLCPVEAVFQEVSFRRYSRLVDVGGGLGAFSAAALAAAPHLKGHLFDLPNVIAQAKQVCARVVGRPKAVDARVAVVSAAAATVLPA